MLCIFFASNRVFHTIGEVHPLPLGPTPGSSRIRRPLLSSAITLLLTHKWPQYFLPTQPTNHLESLTTLFQILPQVFPSTFSPPRYCLLKFALQFSFCSLLPHVPHPSPPTAPNASDQPPGWVEPSLPVKGAMLAA